ncbi:MAG: 4-hydroxy-3-methylbut-2-enyl diphosphate reductase [SAR324 cluster bacterium]|nr:4-hydroxy-3-methylbut-2-enyl diphosphate reductase [SAR324 cluster bacterium]
MKKIIVAEAQGFCWGVRRALEIVENQGPVSILGDLIHNKQVVKTLEAKGKIVIHEVTRDEKNPIVITAHGTTTENIDLINSLKKPLLDTTCPLVATIYDEGKKLEDAGCQILIIGDKNHVEVKGIASRMHEPLIANNEEELDKLVLPSKLGIICQSTFSPKKFDIMVEQVCARIEEVYIKNTICHPTKRRQLAAERLVKQVDIMIVIGGFHSSNTKKLAALAKQYIETHHVETDEDIQKEWFEGKNEIGITAGASTADWIINAIVQKIASFEEGTLIELKDQEAEISTN